MSAANESSRTQSAGRKFRAERFRKFLLGEAGDEPIHEHSVLRDELRLIESRRRALDSDYRSTSGVPAETTHEARTSTVDAVPAPSQHGAEEPAASERLVGARRNAWRAGLLGLCFSGGGIRSATFNLGVLQALASHRLLRHVDYLSTVSGGGYVGGWLTALLQRRFAQKRFDAQEFAQFEQALSWSAGDGSENGPTRELEAVSRLREYSNFITPQLGFFSADTWALFAIYLRNVVLNQLVLVFAFAFLLLLPRALANGFPSLGFFDARFAGAGLIAAVVLIIVIAAGSLRAVRAGFAKLASTGNEPDDSARMLPIVLLSGLAIGLLAAYALPGLAGRADGLPLLGARGTFSLAGIVANFVVWRSIGGATFDRTLPAPYVFRFLNYAVPGALLGASLLGCARLFEQIDADAYLLTIGPPLVIAATLVSAMLHLGLAGNDFTTLQREWLSRLGGLLAIAAICWFAVICLVVFSSLAVDLLPRYLNVSLIAGWLGTTLSGVYLGGRSDGRSSSGLIKRLVMTAAPWIFIAGLFVLLSAGLQGALHATAEFVSNGDVAARVTASWQDYRAGLEAFTTGTAAPLPVSSYGEWIDATGHAWPVGVLLLVSAFFGLLLSVRVDINSFSLHNLYANRIIRCFLGASVEDREDRQERFTRFSREDDLSLFGSVNEIDGTSQCGHAIASADTAPVEEAELPVDAVYPGPYPIINTAINLSGSRNTAWQERKAGSFVLSPRYCGFAPLDGGPGRRAYRPTAAFSSRPKRLTLGESLATSGAAASPNMGYHTTAALAFLLGIFNIRLGRWVGNPSDRAVGANVGASSATPSRLKPRWKDSGPKLALLNLLAEVFGRTHDESRFVYLSDGGHFENLGIYEMVRRRCRFVLACDSGADGNYAFVDLGNAVRKCRIDLGVEIEIDVREIARIDEQRCNASPCAVGRIRYPEGDVGTLVYVKSSRRHGMPSDVLQYAEANAAFPHESTADQFFSESQFESYRRLGYYLTREILDTALQEFTPHGVRSRIDLETLFRRLAEHWYPGSEAIASNFSRLTERIDALFDRLRTSRDLDYLSEQFYPEWRTLMIADDNDEPQLPAEHRETMWRLPGKSSKLAEGFYFCNSLIQLMEDVYLDLNLESEWDHPDNSGWMNVFRHWTWSSMFRVTWAIAAATYGHRFRAFCRLRLKLELGTVTAERIYPDAAAGDAVFETCLEQSRLNVVERHQVATLMRQGRDAGRVELYRLDIKVKLPDGVPLEQRLLRTFGIGYALIDGDELVMFRIQDHLRNMGLGRHGLEALTDALKGRDLVPSVDAEALLTAIAERFDRRLIAEFAASLRAVQRARRASAKSKPSA